MTTWCAPPGRTDNGDPSWIHRRVCGEVVVCRGHGAEEVAEDDCLPVAGAAPVPRKIERQAGNAEAGEPLADRAVVQVLRRGPSVHEQCRGPRFDCVGGYRQSRGDGKVADRVYRSRSWNQCSSRRSSGPMRSASGNRPTCAQPSLV